MTGAVVLVPIFAVVGLVLALAGVFGRKFSFEDKFEFGDDLSTGQRAIAIVLGSALIAAALAFVLVEMSRTQEPAAAAPSVTAQPVATAETPPPAPVHEGRVDAVAPADGVDLDGGRQPGPEAEPGLDVSGRRAEYVLDSVATGSGGLLARLPPGLPVERSSCDRLPTIAWHVNQRGVPAGQSMCVRTDRGGMSILTVVTPWTADTEEGRRLSFTYRTWT